jgi:hypothetical protein
MPNKCTIAAWGAYAPYLFINLLFVLKYTQQVTPYFVAIGGGYVMVGIVLWYMMRWGVERIKHSLFFVFSLFVLLLTVGLCLQYSISPYALQVDRWSAIHFFWDACLQGDYPYAAGTHLGGYGSPFPVWQLFHLPFYLLGNVGLSIFFVTALLLWVVYRSYGVKVTFFVLSLLCLSPAYWYEVAVRSDLITNMLLVAAFVVWLHYKRISLSGHVVGLACIIGLLASTRFVALVPIAVLYGKQFLQLPFKQQCTFVGVLLLVFVLTFLPFLCWDGSMLLYFQYNPFVLQTRQGSWLVLLLFACIATSLVLCFATKKQSVFLLIGCLLTMLVMLAFAEKMLLNDAWGMLFTPMFDITYFSAALPFYCLYTGICVAK